MLLVYDGGCWFCGRLAYMLEWLSDGRIRRLPASEAVSHQPGVMATWGFTAEELQETWWLLDYGGKKAYGGRAVMPKIMRGLVTSSCRRPYARARR